jgi:hypothetical protein
MLDARTLSQKAWCVRQRASVAESDHICGEPQPIVTAGFAFVLCHDRRGPLCRGGGRADDATSGDVGRERPPLSPNPVQILALPVLAQQALTDGDVQCTG